ncbi:MAG: LPS export ABC transporter periplasmic protein LptC [Vicingaceae bacterium]
MKQVLKGIHTNTLKAAFSLLLLSVFFACENDPEEIAKYDMEVKLPTQSGKDVEILYSTKGRVSFQLNAPVLDQYGGKEPYREMPEGVHIKVFDSLMNVTSELTSNYAIDLQHDRIMEAKEDVVVVNEKGERLNTEHLVWNQKTDKITSDVFVKITTKEQVLMGEGLIANPDFTDYEILKPRGTINIEND